MYYLLSVLKWVFYLFMGLFALIGLSVLLVGLFGTKTGLVIGMGLSILLLGAFCYGVAFFLNRFSKRLNTPKTEATPIPEVSPEGSDSASNDDTTANAGTTEAKSPN